MFELPTGIRFNGEKSFVFLPKAGIISPTDVSSEERMTFTFDHYGDFRFNEEYFEGVCVEKELEADELIINSTSECGGSCSYCYKMTELNGEVRTVKFSDITEHLTSAITRLSLMGGEPLLNMALIRDILANTQLQLSVSTGLFVDWPTFYEFTDIVDEFANRMRVQISIDPMEIPRTGKFGESVFEKACMLLSRDVPTNIRSTLRRGNVAYWDLRSDFENTVGREVDAEFEFVSQSDLLPSQTEWLSVVEHLMDDVDGHLAGRKYVPLEVMNTAEVMAKSMIEHPGGWALESGCATYNGAAKVIEPDGRVTRCCMPVDLFTDNKQKCIECHYLRECGMRCFVKAGEDFLCMTSSTRAIAAAYAITRRL